MTNSKKQRGKSLDNLKPMLDERAELQDQKKKIEKKIKELDEVIRPVLLDQGAIIHNNHQFECQSVAGRVTYDYKAMIEDGIDLEPYKKVGKPSSRLVIKDVQVV